MAIEDPASTPDNEPVSDVEAAWNELASATPDIPDDPPARAASDATADGTDTRARDEKGRFAAKAEEAAQKAAEPPSDLKAPTEPPALEQAQAAPQEGIEAKPRVGPPPGWSVAAKSQFDALPDAVREAVVNREQEINQGFAKLADYRGLEPYVDMAKQNGTTITKAFEAYTRAEQEFARDFVNGTVGICGVYNVHPLQLAQELMARYGGGNQTPAMQQQPAPDPRLSALEQRLAQYERQREMEEQQTVNGTLQQFAADPAHRYFENVRHDMAKLITSGMAEDLKDAYDKACWANPEIRALQIKEAQQPAIQQRAQAVNQAVRASKSIPNGVPDPGVKPATRTYNTTRSATEAAWDELAGQL